jgi:hypothetical protein
MKSFNISVSRMSIASSKLVDAERAQIIYDGTAISGPDAIIDKIGAMNFPAEEKKNILDYAKRRRWEIETGGITVSGMTIATDDRSKLMIQGGRTAADADPGFTTKWDLGDASIELTAEQVIAISNAVLAHVQAVFAKHDTISDAINADEITSTVEIDAAYAA